MAHLKKMYLLRNAHEQTLLQIISRVNRPYRAPATKKSYRYGYIVDFVDIEAEFDRTIEKYLAELSAEFALQGEDGVSFKGLVVGPEEIRQQCDYILRDRELRISNIEKFTVRLAYGPDRCMRSEVSERDPRHAGRSLFFPQHEYAKRSMRRIKSLLMGGTTVFLFKI